MEANICFVLSWNSHKIILQGMIWVNILLVSNQLLISIFLSLDNVIIRYSLGVEY